MSGYTLFMEKYPRMAETYRGAQASVHTFLVPDHTSFVLLSYEVEDVATELCIKTQCSRSAAGKSRKEALFKTSTVATCGTKTVVEPHSTQLKVEIKTKKGKAKWEGTHGSVLMH